METKAGAGNKYIGIIIIAIIALFFMARFGAIGLRTILGIILLFFIPVYLILARLGFNIIERAVFSIFLGIGIIPTIIYFLGLVISFRVAIFIVAIINILLSVIMIIKFRKI